MQPGHSSQQQLPTERDITVLLRAPLRAVHAEEAFRRGGQVDYGKWGETSGALAQRTGGGTLPPSIGGAYTPTDR
jgi:hypothetical protein